MIYPIEVRDLLFWFAYYDLYTPKWSQHIFTEWQSVMQRRKIPEEEIQKRLARANHAFPDALVTNYEPLIEGLELPDPDDCHVMAAAIKVNANVIVTNNVKDFPEPYLKQFGLSVKRADDFLAETIDPEPERAVSAFRELVLHRRNPDLDEYEVLDALRRNNLKDTADYLHALL